MTPSPAAAPTGSHPLRRAAAAFLAALTLVVLVLASGASGAAPPSGPAPGAPEAAVLLRDAPARQATMVPPIRGAGPAAVRRAFAAPLQPWGRGHRGLDLDAPAGAAVVAPADGVVRYAGQVVDRPVLTVVHDDGTVSSMEPVEPLVEVGTRVSAGETIGEVAAAPPHCATGCLHCATSCLHWGVRREDDWQVGAARFDRYLDPLVLLGWSGPSVLWPSEQ
ncbi:M23 family metallopeptidase [Micrococcus sp.]|uniref:M23 family metallopeptidase n=1 Tax=Micrococcus sp. TaxID=1271 RepID=UPI002A912A6C|nr:peptidoglycan DD-metalloendopeptidase family protein [Micrococcus sp.]MDY6054697.1 peptidoglycan DD-metalloendopeptidase family protein [Micrococcus sp.]